MNKIRILLSFVTLFILALLLIFAGSVVAQQSHVYTDPDRDLKEGMDLFRKQKYAAAFERFENVKKRIASTSSQIRAEASYYSALSSMELFNADGAARMENFLHSYPGNVHADEGRFHLARYYYRSRKFKDAIEWFRTIDPYDVEQKELAEYYFKKGYSYFETGALDSASRMFFEIKDVDTKYTAPARYYYAHIAYLNNNYETALQTFNQVASDPQFAAVIPYYTSQIYFKQKRFEKVVEYATSLPDSIVQKRQPEISRLIAESYYNLGKYRESLEYFERYRKTSSLERDDHYKIGYAFYKSGDCRSSIEELQKVLVKDDSLSQTAAYTLGACYVSLNNKQAAFSAFEQASRFSFDKKLQEDAHFNVVKLAYELSAHPYTQAVNAIKKYIETYPQSTRRGEAEEMLIAVFLNTRNYPEAINALESMKARSKELDYAYQKVVYNYATELFARNEFSRAIPLYSKAHAAAMDKVVSAQAIYWRGESNYNLRKMQEAISDYKEFIFEPGAALTTEFPTVNYNLGYVYFQQKDYPEAISWFRKYVQLNPSDKKRLHDALVRVGDSYFISRDYPAAAEYYSQATYIKDGSSDYALFQQAVALGLTDKRKQKTDVLQNLISSFPGSNYADDAKLELGRTYQEMDENERALQYYRAVVSDHPKSPLAARAKVQEALVHYNLNQDEKALELYRGVVSQHPGTQEAMDALAGIKSIYVSQGKGESYAEYVKSVPFAQVTTSELDSTTFESAEVVYMKQECENAVRQLQNYLSKFPEGAFQNKARFYRADCLQKLKRNSEAIEEYLKIAGGQPGNFTEKSTGRAALLLYNEKRYDQAKPLLQKVESYGPSSEFYAPAIIALMEIHSSSGATSDAAMTASKVLELKNLRERTAAHARLLLAKDQISRGDTAAAISSLKLLEKGEKNTYAAEGKFLQAEMLYKAGRYADAEKEAMGVVQQYEEFDYWVARSFILLADIYVAQKDYFQAKATLQSIIENYEGEDLRKVAVEKLQQTEKAEAESQMVPEKKQEEIQINE